VPEKAAVVIASRLVHLDLLYANLNEPGGQSGRRSDGIEGPTFRPPSRRFPSAIACRVEQSFHDYSHDTGIFRLIGIPSRDFESHEYCTLDEIV